MILLNQLQLPLSNSGTHFKLTNRETYRITSLFNQAKIKKGYNTGLSYFDT